MANQREPKNRMQVMQSVLIFNPGTIVTIPQVSKCLGLDFEENSDMIISFIENLLENDILAVVYPNCFVAETIAGGNPFLLVWTLVHENMYVSNIGGIKLLSFEELTQQPDFIPFYEGEEWPNSLKEYLTRQKAKPVLRIAYGQSIPNEDGSHDLAGYIYTGTEAVFVNRKLEVTTKILTVSDVIEGRVKHLTMFANHAEAKKYCDHVLNTHPVRGKSGRRVSTAVLEKGGIDGESNIEMKSSKTLSSDEMQDPGDKKRFSLNELHKIWSQLPSGALASTIKKAFFDNALAELI